MNIPPGRPRIRPPFPALRGHLPIVLAWMLATASCGATSAQIPKNWPAPVQSTTVGPGDVFSVIVVGEKELPTEYRVQPDGSVDFPYVSRFTVAGLEPQEIVDAIKKKLVEAKILQDPQVILQVKQYNSKRVSIIGSVTKPGSVPWTESMRLVDAISQAGWFTPLADSKHVIITRRTTNLRTVTAVVSVDAITDGKQSDMFLQAGDTIKVEQRTF